MSELPQAHDVTAETPHADANPAKEFFIDVITKDIGLERAILDLVDNSVDGARQFRSPPTDENKLEPVRSYEGLRIDLTVSPDEFVIQDNCGGMSLETAQQYAFRFGRKQKNGTPRITHSIGLFGIGMKRALFKLGDHFRIESTSAYTHFVIDQDVNEWQARDDWDFPFADARRYDSEVPVDRRGTKIRVTELHDTVRADFARENWRNGLVAQLKDALREPIARGLVATVNGDAVEAEKPSLYVSDRIRPQVTEFSPPADPDVTVRMYVGVAEGNLDRAGWYVFCNDRLVIAGDQTSLTGWGAKDPVAIPKFHNQFHRFWGYVYMDSDDPSKLPWNTTKTGIDTDSPLWRAVKQHMIIAMKPVIEFLNALRREEKAKPARGAAADQQTRSTPLVREFAEAARAARDVDALFTQGPRSRFEWPVTDTEPSGPKEVLIKYTRPVEQVEKAMEFFGVNTSSEVGLNTFLYWQRAEA